MSDEAFPAGLLYHPAHAWARLDGEEATLGITSHAQDQLGEILFFEAPSVGAQVVEDQPYAELESAKAISDVIAPLSGEICEVNEALRDDPRAINEDPYGTGWMVRVRLRDPAAGKALLHAREYAATLETSGD